jgi:Trypsin-like peptidase domain
MSSINTFILRVLIAGLALSCGACAAQQQVHIQSDVRQRLVQQKRSGSLRVDVDWRLSPDIQIGMRRRRMKVSLADYLESDTPRRVIVSELQSLGYRMAQCTTRSPTLESTILDAEYGTFSGSSLNGAHVRINLRWRLWSEHGELASSHVEAIVGKSSETVYRAFTESLLRFMDTSIPPRGEVGIESRVRSAPPTPDINFYDALPKYRESIAAVRTPQGHLTAFIVSEDGLALTSSRAADFQLQGARCAGQQEYRVDLLCVVPETGVALLRIHGDGFTPLPLRAASSGFSHDTGYVVTAPGFPGASHRVFRGMLTTESSTKFRSADLDRDTELNREGAPIFDSEGMVVAMVAGTRGEILPAQVVVVVAAIDRALSALRVPFD